MTRHLLSMADLSGAEVYLVLDLAEDHSPPQALAGLGVALVFEHPSTRTRNAAEVAVAQLGGHPVSIRGEEVGIDQRETAEDIARTLGCYHCMIGARVERHSTLVRMAASLDAAKVAVPVINRLSDYEHPTQAIADLLTVRQHYGSLEGRVIAYVGDSNNVCRSLVAAGGHCGVTLHLATPKGYSMSAEELAAAEA
ncbi:MAG: ornithine carbamoyltransferase, partial [Acidimicrobiales bacterium]